MGPGGCENVMSGCEVEEGYSRRVEVDVEAVLGDSLAVVNVLEERPHLNSIQNL